MQTIIKKPIITEKITKDGEIFNRFGFIVAKTANKIQIKIWGVYIPIVSNFAKNTFYHTS